MSTSLAGETRRWREGDILFAENDVARMAFVATTDKEKLSGFKLGWHPYRDTEMCVEYITPEQAEAWQEEKA